MPQKPTYLNDDGEEVQSSYLDDDGIEIPDEADKHRSEYKAKWGGIEPMYGPETEKFLSTSLAPDIKSEPDTWWGGFGKGLYENFVQPATSPRSITQEVLGGKTIAGLAKKGLPKIGKSVAAGVVPETVLPAPKKPIANVTDDIDANLYEPESTTVPEIIEPHKSVVEETAQKSFQLESSPEFSSTRKPEVVKGMTPKAPKTMADEALEAANEMERKGDIEGAREQRETVSRMLDEEGHSAWSKSVKPARQFEQSVTGSPDDILNPDQPLNWKNDPQKKINSAKAIAARKGVSNEMGPKREFHQMTPDELKKSVPQDDMPKLLKESSDELKSIPPDAPPEVTESMYRKVSNFNRSLLTAMDFSAPGRQGKGLITHKGYWTSFDDMFRAWGSKRGYENVQQSILNDPTGLFQPNINLKGKSFAQAAGLDLTDVVKNREEIFRSKLAEKIPGVERSQRAYVAFLNKARADVFKELVTAAKKAGRDPEKDLVLAKQLANSINVSTGRGSFGQLENSATAMKTLNEIFFAPKLMASRVQMYSRVLNPKTYTELDPIVRNEAIRSLLGIVGTAGVVGELARLGGAKVSNDPTNSDFRKIKIGNTRIDNMAGLQQYGVATARLLSGQSTSSTSGRTTNLTKPKFGQQTRADVMTNFFTNKLAPIPSFVWAWMNTREFDGEPFEVKKALLNRTVPIVMQDLYELYQEDPSLLPLGVLPVMGEGLQTYGR